MKRNGTCFTGMSRETVVVVLAFCGALFVFVNWTGLPGGHSQIHCARMIQQSVERSYSHVESLLAIQSNTKDSGLRFSLQRNQLSLQLNEMKKIVGQMSCREVEYRKKLGEKMDHRVSVSGGWCAEDSSPGSKEHVFDKGFATALGTLLTGKTVGSFGEGTGDYKAYFDRGQLVTSYTGYDGAPFCENTTNGQVLFLDLTAPQYGLPAFQWVVSVEVGEHIPAQFEDIYVDNLARHAREGIVISWATPGQEGLSHVNLKSVQDLISVMRKKGFTIDGKEGEKLRAAATVSWLQKNLQVFKRNDPATFLVEDV